MATYHEAPVSTYPTTTTTSSEFSSNINLEFYPSSYASNNHRYDTYGTYISNGFSTEFAEVPRETIRAWLKPGWLEAFGAGGYEGEPPLLEELGVNIGRTGAKSGTLHVSHLYTLALLGSVSLHVLFTLLSPPPSSPASVSTSTSPALSYAHSISILGYCLLPLVFTAAIGTVMPLDGLVGYALCITAVGWCTVSASGILAGKIGGEIRALLAWPLGLFYGVFGVMVVFGRG